MKLLLIVVQTQLFPVDENFKLDYLCQYSSAMLMYNYINNNLPRSFDNIFSLNKDIQPTYVICQSDQLYIQRCVLNGSSKLPLYTLPQIWNKWTNTASGVSSPAQFVLSYSPPPLMSTNVWTNVVQIVTESYCFCWLYLYVVVLSCTLIKPCIIIVNVSSSDSSLGLYFCSCFCSGETQTKHHTS